MELVGLEDNGLSGCCNSCNRRNRRLNNSNENANDNGNIITINLGQPNWGVPAQPVAPNVRQVAPVAPQARVANLPVNAPVLRSGMPVGVPINNPLQAKTRSKVVPWGRPERHEVVAW